MAVETASLNLTVPAPKLAEAVAKVSRALPARASMPITTGILLKVDEEGLRLTATDLSSAIRCRLAADISRPGAIVVPARLLQGALAGLPDAPLELTTEGLTLRLLCARTRATIRCLDAADFPPANVQEEGDQVGVAMDDLVAGIGQVAGFAGADDNRPVFTAVLLQIGKGGLTMVASDGYRIAECRLPADVPASFERSVLVPARMVNELPRVFKGGRGDVAMLIAPKGNQVTFRAGGSEVISRVIEGEFPHYLNVISDSYPTTTRVDAGELKRALASTITFAPIDSFAVRLQAADGCLTVSALAAEVGDGATELDAEVGGDPADVKLNARFLAEVLDVIGRTVEIRCGGPRHPLLVVDPDDDGFRYAFAPIVGGG